MNKFDKIAISNIRTFCMEIITNAKSGHPGMALGAAPIMHTLYTRVLKQTSKDSNWFDRDRFILAAGHGSSLLYTALHLGGYKISKEDLIAFRKLGSITPGHPELGKTDGIDAASGPLGQGIPTGCGMALAERFLAERYNKEGFELFNHYTYVLCGDGDIQEGVTQEALSLIGHLKLNKLVIVYDSNDIQLDGEVSKCNTEDIKKKVEAMGFNYTLVTDSENVDKLEKVLLKAKESDKPSFIEVKTKIGFGCLSEGTSKCHGAPLPEDEVIEMRNKLGGEKFEIFDASYVNYKKYQEKTYEEYLKHQELLKEYAVKYPELYKELFEEKEVTVEDLEMPFNKDYNKATRYGAGDIFKKLSQMDPNLIGGSADLASSTQVTGLDNRRIDYGVREHAMAAITNGITLHSFTKGFCSGFFVFSDYLKPAVRMSALMNLPVIYCFSHDSIAVGEDGPTHQPIEQLTMLRSIPNVNVIRPCSLTETKEACVIAINSKETPTVIVCTRQNVNEYRLDDKVNETLKGAYVLSKEKDKLDAVLISTGSEVGLAISAQEELYKQGVDIRVVSMPSIFLFEKQTEEYKKEVLPENTNVFAIEMSEAAHYYKYVSGKGELFNIITFGESGKANDVIEYFGFTKEKISEKMLNKLK